MRCMISDDHLFNLILRFSLTWLISKLKKWNKTCAKVKTQPSDVSERERLMTARLRPRKFVSLTGLCIMESDCDALCTCVRNPWCWCWTLLLALAWAFDWKAAKIACVPPTCQEFAITLTYKLGWLSGWRCPEAVRFAFFDTDEMQHRITTKGSVRLPPSERMKTSSSPSFGNGKAVDLHHFG